MAEQGPGQRRHEIVIGEAGQWGAEEAAAFIERALDAFPGSRELVPTNEATRPGPASISRAASATLKLR
jgi:hypothetical protein